MYLTENKPYNESYLYNEDSFITSTERPSFFDFIFGFFIAAMLATNYSPYNDLVSNIGLGVSILFLFTLFVQRYHFQRELIVLLLLYGWTLMCSLLSDYRTLAFLSTFYLLKVQFVLLVVALRCTSIARLVFYLFCLGIGCITLVLPSLFTAAYLASDERLIGTVGQPNAMGSISSVSFIVWVSLFFVIKKWWKWIICPLFAVSSLRVLVLTGSRGSFLTALAFLVVGVWFLWWQGRLGLKLFILVAASVFVVAFIHYMVETQMLKRLAVLASIFGFEVRGAEGETHAVRVGIMKTAISLFLESPFFGKGYGTFRMYSAYVYTHTTPFDMLYGTGLIGTLLYYYVIISSWLVFRKAKKYFPFGRERVVINICQALIFAQLVQGMALPYQSSKPHAVLSGVWLGMAWYMRRRGEATRYQVAENYDVESYAEAGRPIGDVVSA
jgi:O-antigen ligase